MATTPRSRSTKSPEITVVLPQTIVKAARSRPIPDINVERGQDIAKRSINELLNKTARAYRTATTTTALLRLLAKAEGPISTACHNIVQIANCNHVVTAKDAITHQFSPEGTALANSILASMDTLYDYTMGFATKKSLESLKAHALREVLITGGIAGELVPNKAGLPDSFQIVPFESLVMKSNGKGGYYPTQVVLGETDPIDLNIASFFVSMQQHDAGSVYPFSMMESAIKLIVYFEEFMEDIRRVVRQTGHTRLSVTLDAEKIVKMAPQDIQRDPNKLKTFLSEVQTAVQRQLESLSPEQALVLFDTAEVEHLQSGMGSKVDYTPMLGVISGMMATSMKTPPSAIGLRLEGGSQALGNIESLIFLKSAAAIQTPVEEVFSRMLTLGCRLYGLDVYVRFEFDEIDLRPHLELEAFRNMKQDRILELLSLGLITDDFAAHLLGMGPRPPGAKDLSGTMFHSKSAAGPTFPGDTAMGRTLQPDKDVPRKAGGASQ